MKKQETKRSTRKPLKLPRFLTVLMLSNISLATSTMAYDFSYQGRLSEPTGKPVTGPVKMELRFYNVETGGSPLLTVGNGLESVALNQGIFQVSVSLSEVDYHSIFSTVDSPVWVEIVDQSNAPSAPYPRHKISMMPYAAKIPIDTNTLSFDSSGRLTLKSMTGDSAIATISTAGKVSGAAITSGTIGGTASFQGSGGVSTTGHVVVSATGGASTELRFGDNDNSNYVGFKSAGNVSSDRIWTLPSADGSNGTALTTNGSGVLSWSAISLGAGVSGTLPVGNGGTGVTTLTSHGMLYGNGTSAVQATAAGSQYSVLVAGSGGTPSFGTVALDQSVAVSGTLPIARGGTGVTTTPSNGSLMIGNGTGYAVAGLAQGANASVTITNGAGTITLDAAQDIRTSASPTFAGLGIGSGTFTTTGNMIGGTLLAGTNEASGTAAAGMIRGTHKTGSDAGGNDLIIAAGNGTGTGGSGAINFQTAPSAASSSTANTLATVMTVAKTGNVGIGSTSPAAKLQLVGGQFIGEVVSGSNTTLDFHTGNSQSTDAAAGTITLSNAINGGAYLVALTNATGGNYTFASSGDTVYYSPTGPVTVSATKPTICTIVKIGTRVYVNWIKDFQQ